MQEAATTPETTAKAYDPFDLGDTSNHLPPRDDRPRNADGTFAPAEAPPAPVVEQAPVPAPVDPLRQTMLREAAELGMDPEALTDLPVAALFQTVNFARRKEAEHYREMSRAKNLMDSEVRQPEPKPEQLFFGVDPTTGQPYTEEDLHPSTVVALKQNQELRKLLVERETRDRNRDQAEVADAIDDVFAGMDERLFGKGSGADLAKSNDPGLKRRMIVLHEAGIIGNRMTASVVRRSAAKINAAAELLYKPVAATTRPEAPAKPNPYVNGNLLAANGQELPSVRVTPSDWDEAAVAVPTSRPPAELPAGPERAVRNLESRIAELGRATSARNRQSDADIKRGLFPGGSSVLG